MLHFAIERYGKATRAAIHVLTVALVIGAAAPAQAGQIAGTIRDASTLAPLPDIDLDLLDLNHATVPVEAVTQSDGTYLLTPVPSGQYYLRADPSVTQGYVDQYYPGVFLEGDASVVSVSSVGTTTVNFFLEKGGVITGHIFDAGTGTPLDSTDLDVYAWDGSFIPSINDNSEADGSYLLGAFPPGTFYVRADPEPLSFYVLRYFDDKVSLETADPIVIAGEETVSGIDLRLPGGGVIGGTIRDMAGIPLAGIDIDIFDSSGMQITDLDDDTDAAGHYEIGAMEPGLYYVLADPDPALGYIDTFFGGSFQIETATPVGVSAGVYASGIDIYLPTGGTISGRVTSVVGGSPVDGTRIHAFDSSGHSLSGQSVSTAADGTYRIGAFPPGVYFLRCDGDEVTALAFEFYPGVTFLSEAGPITAYAGVDVPNIDFTLDPAGWISGRVLADDTGLPLGNIDLDVYGPDGEPVTALDAQTLSSGYYTLGRVPGGQFLVRADPSGIAPYDPQFYDMSPTIEGATAVTVTPGFFTSSINFRLLPEGTSGVGEGTFLLTRLAPNAPNPFNPRTSIRYELASPGFVRLLVFDVQGRLQRRLVEGSRSAGVHEVVWDGTDESGRPLASGVYYYRMDTDGFESTRKMILAR